MTAREKADNKIPSIKDAIGVTNNTEPLVKLKPWFRNTIPYSVKLKDPRWQKKRLEIMDRDKFTCRICGDDKSTLVVHHLKYQGEPWNAPNDKLITVCEHCHRTIEDLKDSIKDFSTLKIIKRKFPIDYHLSLLEFIFFDSNTYLSIYDNNKTQIVGLSFTNETANEISDLFIKYSI